MMPGTVVEKTACENCGADVRENTLFCYNCGNRVADTGATDHDRAEEESGAEAETETETEIEDKEADTETGVDNKDAGTEAELALNELAERIKIEPPSEEDEKRAKAAAERKKARVNPRKPRQVVWEPVDDAPNRILLLISVLIAVIAGAVVFVTIFWK